MKSQATNPTRVPNSRQTADSVQERAPTEIEEGRLDRRVQRTKRALQEALIRLVRERGWDDVSVQDVCERADVGRSTFYLHFADKEELLVSGFGELRKMLRAHLSPDRGKPLGFTTALLEHAREYEPLFKTLVGRRTGAVVQRAFMDLVRELVASDLGFHGQVTTATQDATIAYVAGAFWELLRWWLEQRRHASAADVDAIFKRLTAPVLREARRLEGSVGR